MSQESKRIVRGEATYGSDAWSLPLRHVNRACMTDGEGEGVTLLAVDLVRGGATYTVRLSIPATLDERARQVVELPGAPQPIRAG
jgi:hypothetical protein